jgi:hypothetical protein
MNFIKHIAAIIFLWVVHPLLAGSEIVKEFDVEPLTRYRMTFHAKADPGLKSNWELRFFTKDGVLPHEGVYKNDWQAIRSEQENYRHEVLSPKNAGILKLIVNSQGQKPEITDLTLEKIEDKNLVINGDFAAGFENYSGWTTRYMAELVKNDDGKLVLKCEAPGYAITDYIPVQAGGKYRLLSGSTGGGRVLLYNHNLLRIGMLFEGGMDPVKNPVIEIPSGVSFMRVEYCDGRAYSNRVPVIRFLGITQAGVTPATAPETRGAYPAEIVLSPDAPLQEIRAAREIQHWVEEISGKTIPVLAEPSGGDLPKIHVGAQWAKDLFPEDFKTLEGSDGYAVRSKGKDIYVFGARPAGALHGAIRLLEENSDLIFARPRHVIGVVYSKNPNFAFQKADFIQRPAFAYRMSHLKPASTTDDGIWQGRLGMNTSPFLYNGFRSREMGGNPSFEGNFMGVIEQNPETSFEKCSKEHPEFYAMIDGERKIVPQGYICYTAPGIAQALANGIRKVIERKEQGGEKLEFVNLRTRDGWAVCSCPTCMTPIKLPDGTLLESKAETSQQDPVFFSTRMALLMNDVAKEMAKTHPHLNITVPGYIYASEPPAVMHAPSLSPDFCAYPTATIRFPLLEGQNNHHEVGREWEFKFREFLSRAQKSQGKLCMFAYYYPAGFSAVADAAGADWKEMDSVGAAYKITFDGWAQDIPPAKGVNPWDYEAIEKWIIAKLMWNPQANPQELRTQYIQRAYKEAAPEMQEFYDTIRKTWSDPEIKAQVNCHTPSSALFDTFIIKPGNEEKLRSLLLKAQDKAANPNSKALIERNLAAFDKFAEGMNRTYIPYVEESTMEWENPESTFWLQALKLQDFKQVSTWDNFKSAPSAHPTEVAIMRDKDNLYVRFDAQNASNQRDQVEIHFEAKRNTIKSFLSVNRSGKPYGMKNGSPQQNLLWNSKVMPTANGYHAMFRIPFSSLENLDMGLDVAELPTKFGRLVGDDKLTEESTLDGLSITTTQFPNHWKVLSIKK